MATHEPVASADRPLRPDYQGACVTNLAVALLENPAAGEGWIPQYAANAKRRVILVIDGLGWNQLVARLDETSRLLAGDCRAISTVAPTTTAAALTSITTGVPPGEHGIVGYKVRVGYRTLNVLRWTTSGKDARPSISPTDLQPCAAFFGRSVDAVSPAEFAKSGLTEAYLGATCRYRGYSGQSTLIYQVLRAFERGANTVFAYYDQLDRVGHEFGHGLAYDIELRSIDAMVGDLRNRLASDVALVITADHGQVECAVSATTLHPQIEETLVATSGEARFLWLHALEGRAFDVETLARQHHSGDDQAWVLGLDEVLDLGLLGPMVTSAARQKLGDVALVARGTGAFGSTDEPGPDLIGRHGSLTAEELYVPLVIL